MGNCRSRPKTNKDHIKLLADIQNTEAKILEITETLKTNDEPAHES